MVDEEKETQKEKTVKDKPPKRSPLRLALLAGVVVVLGAGGYFGWSLLNRGASQDSAVASNPSPAKTVQKKEVSKVICPLESFVVNLLDKSKIAKRYLKVTMALEVGDEEARAKVEKHKTQLRDTIILLLTSQTSDEISSAEGKLGLKQEVMNRANLVLGAGVVSRIYFTEFVVQ